jgi:pentose-5-phosphate-3-epimerase
LKSFHTDFHNKTKFKKRWIEKELYVDGLVTGGTLVRELREKEASVEIFKEALFHLHKWQSNVKELEQNEQSDSIDDTSFAK